MSIACPVSKYCAIPLVDDDEAVIIHCSLFLCGCRCSTCQHRQCTNLTPRRYASHVSVCLHVLLLGFLFLSFSLPFCFPMFELVLIEATCKKNCRSCSFPHITDIFKDVGVNQRQSYHTWSKSCQKLPSSSLQTGPSSACQPNTVGL